MEVKLNHGMETEGLQFGGPVPLVIDERGGSVRVSVWREPRSRRDVFFSAEAARRLADAVAVDTDTDTEIVTETAEAGADVVVRHRDGRRELTVPRQQRRGRRVVQLDPFEAEVATGLHEAAAEVERQAQAEGEAA